MNVEVGRLDPSEWLGRDVHVVMDRPVGSVHPKHGAIYPINYGFLPGFISPDGEELDAYVVGTLDPLAECDGVVVAVIKRHDDIEDKLVVAIAGEWDETSIRATTHFQERFYTVDIITL